MTSFIREEQSSGETEVGQEMPLQKILQIKSAWQGVSYCVVWLFECTYGAV